MTGLDVERLARALAGVHGGGFRSRVDWAAALAAEYDRVPAEERCDVILRIVGGWDIETTAECILPADHDGDHEPGDPA